MARIYNPCLKIEKPPFLVVFLYNKATAFSKTFDNDN